MQPISSSGNKSELLREIYKKIFEVADHEFCIRLCTQRIRYIVNKKGNRSAFSEKSVISQKKGMAFEVTIINSRCVLEPDASAQ